MKVNIVFDGPPGFPDPGRFVEVEDLDGKSVGIGEWASTNMGPEGEDWWILQIEVPDETVRR